MRRGRLRFVSEYKYLGVLFHESGTFVEHARKVAGERGHWSQTVVAAPHALEVESRNNLVKLCELLKRLTLLLSSLQSSSGEDRF